MALRKPIVQVGGVQQELDLSVDTLAGAFNGIVGPKQMGYNAWTADPMFATSNKNLVNGVVLASMTCPANAIASGTTLTVEYAIGAANVASTYAKIGLYLYNAVTGVATQIGISADLGAAVWNTAGTKYTPVTITTAINAGDIVYVCVLSFATTTTPSLNATTQVSSMGRGLAPFRYGQLTGQNSLPTTFTPASLLTSNQMPVLLY